MNIKKLQSFGPLEKINAILNTNIIQNNLWVIVKLIFDVGKNILRVNRTRNSIKGVVWN